jgi:hypothetical protein
LGDSQPIHHTRETVDLTDESPTSKSHMETINLDDQAVGGDATFGKAFVAKLEKLCDPHHITCPICEKLIKKKLFCDHLDGCYGFVREILFTMKRGLHNPGPSSSKRFKFNSSRR